MFDFQLILVTLFLIALGVVPIVVPIMLVVSRRKKIKKGRLDTNSFFKESNASFIASADKSLYLFDSMNFNDDDYKQMMFFDFNKKKVLLFDYRTESSFLLDFSDIVGCDKSFVSNTETNGSIYSGHHSLKINSQVVNKFVMMNLIIKTKNKKCPIITYELFIPTLFKKNIKDNESLFRKILTSVNNATAMFDIILDVKKTNKFVFCKYCGAKNSDDATECKKCGSTL